MYSNTTYLIQVASLTLIVQALVKTACRRPGGQWKFKAVAERDIGPIEPCVVTGKAPIRPPLRDLNCRTSSIVVAA
ncbi:hypothetical protein N657DRAFT_650318 [Parathielavia appendiculata]|uniref:Secreted protein n=1 Tax=Parathielavia appendiculata TaxID=2587402 RepID=A0AAN6Z0D1_9PEZI|nr:hypothetical protein N657DRAFT_650318 [Parathielavia appendiculata]